MYYMEKVFIYAQRLKKDENFGGKAIREAATGGLPALF